MNEDKNVHSAHALTDRVGPLSQELLLFNFEVQREFPYNRWKLCMMSIPGLSDMTTLRDIPENAPGTCAIYRFCFTEFMCEMLHTFSKDVLRGIKY